MTSTMTRSGQLYTPTELGRQGDLEVRDAWPAVVPLVIPQVCPNQLKFAPQYTTLGCKGKRHFIYSLVVGLLAIFVLLHFSSSLSAEDTDETLAGVACGTFVDAPDGVDLSGIAAMGMFGREVAAAGLCAQANDIASACKHYSHALKLLDGLKSVLATELRLQVAELKQQLACPELDTSTQIDHPAISNSID